METWRQQNRAPFEALQEIARSKPRAEVPMILQVEIPETASPAMEELIVQRVQLRNERAKLANTLRDATPESRAAAVRQWHDRNQATLLALHDQAAAVAAESRQLLLPLPPPLRIPDGASSSLQNFMAERHARLRQSIEQENRVRRLSLGEQGAARQLLRSQKTPPAFLSFPPGESISQPESPTPSYP
jgi:hypothetical protein